MTFISPLGYYLTSPEGSCDDSLCIWAQTFYKSENEDADLHKTDKIQMILSNSDTNDF